MSIVSILLKLVGSKLGSIDAKRGSNWHVTRARVVPKFATSPYQQQHLHSVVLRDSLCGEKESSEGFQKTCQWLLPCCSWIKSQLCDPLVKEWQLEVERRISINQFLCKNWHEMLMGWGWRSLSPKWLVMDWQLSWPMVKDRLLRILKLWFSKKRMVVLMPEMNFWVVLVMFTSK